MLTLNNGMRVVVRESRAAPVVALQLWVDVGSADERDERSGIAHVLEHMAFKGTERRGVGEIAKEIEETGGDINAWTSFDETVYHVTMPSRFFARGLDVLADAVLAPKLDGEELKREKEVILEEIKESEDLPSDVASRELFALAYRKHPYRRPVIGRVDVVERLTRAQLRSFMRQHYRPENMVLVVVGDVERGKALAAIRDTFGAVPRATRGKGAARDRIREPQQRALRVTLHQMETREAYVTLGFHAPSLSDPEAPLLDVAAAVLGQGESSRLVRVVKDQLGLVTDIAAYAYTPLDPGLVVVTATCRPEQVHEVVQAIVAEVTRLGEEGVSSVEFERAQALIESDAAYEMETVQGQARRLGYFLLVTGDAQFGAEYRRRLQAVTAERLGRVAQRYLVPANLSLAVVTPHVDTKLERDVRAAVARGVKRVVRKKPPVAKRSGSPGPTRVVLPSGARLVLLRRPDVPLVAMRAVWLGGLRYENGANNGINNLIAAMVTRGTTSASSDEIHGAIEGMAGSISGFSGRNSFGLRLEVLARHQLRALEVVADCILRPAFREEELAGRRREVLDEIYAQQDDPMAIVMDLFASTAYRRHPYRFNPLGSEASVAGFGRQQLQRYFRRHFSPAQMVLAIVGEIDVERISDAAASAFGEFRGRFGPAVTPASEPAGDGARRALRQLDKQQAQVMIGYRGATVRDRERHALELIAALLAGQSGRLFLDLRDQRGLAYRVGAFSQEGIEPGWFAVHVATSPERIPVVLEQTQRHFESLRCGLVGAAELERAKRYLVGSHEVTLQHRAALASSGAFDELFGMGCGAYQKYGQQIAAVSREGLRRAARKYFDEAQAVIAVVRPPEGQANKST